MIARASLPRGYSLDPKTGLALPNDPRGLVIRGNPRISYATSIPVATRSAGAGGGGGGGSFANVNRPGGLTTQLDDNMDRALVANPTSAQVDTYAVNGGWSEGVSWVSGSSRVAVVTDGSGPNGFAGKRNFWSTAPTGSTPGGASKLVRSVSAKSHVYMYVSYRFDSGYDHGTNSEKFIYFENGNNIWLWADGTHKLHNALESGDTYPCDIETGHIRANLEPNGLSGGGCSLPVAPVPADLVWEQLEIVLNISAGSIKWWLDGVPYADYPSGCTALGSGGVWSEIFLDDTWGGSGSKTNDTSGRVIERCIIATN